MQGQELLHTELVAAPSYLCYVPSLPACPGSAGQSPSRAEDGAAIPGRGEHITCFVQPTQLCSRG